MLASLLPRGIDKHRRWYNVVERFPFKVLFFFPPRFRLLVAAVDDTHAAEECRNEGSRIVPPSGSVVVILLWILHLVVLRE